AIRVGNGSNRLCRAAAYAAPLPGDTRPDVGRPIGFTDRKQYVTARFCRQQHRWRIAAGHIVAAAYPCRGGAGGFLARYRPGAITIVIPGIAPEGFRLVC